MSNNKDEKKVVIHDDGDSSDSSDTEKEDTLPDNPVKPNEPKNEENTPPPPPLKKRRRILKSDLPPIRKPKKVKKPESPKKPEEIVITDEEIKQISLLFPFLIPPLPINGNNNHNGGDGEEGCCDSPFPGRAHGNSKKSQYQNRIIQSRMDDNNRQVALQRLKTLDSDKNKAAEWFDTLLNIPFGNYSGLPVTTDHPLEQIHSYFDSAFQVLDDSVYGLDKVKEEIINIIAQIITTNNNTMPRVIGLQGSAGVGKTALIRRGLAKALQRPMVTFCIGGVRDGTYLKGSEYLYVGSSAGRITKGLAEAKVMNPIFFFDELDKVSNTLEGIDIQNILVHLTDPVQNYDFKDKYLDGIQIDLSKVVFIFSFNDEGLVNPILKDRLHIIRVPDPSISEKVVIGTRYLLKEVSHNLGLKDGDIIFKEDVMRFVIKEHCEHDRGVRGLKRCIETLLLKINASRFLGSRMKYKTLKGITLPLIITEEMVRELLEKERNPKDEFIRSMFM